MKKVNKKAILGFAMSMIFSLAIMQGISQKNVQQQDMNLQQIGLGCAVGSTFCEDGGAMEAGLSYAGNVLGGAAGGMLGVGLGVVYLTANPVGLSWWVATGVVAL